MPLLLDAPRKTAHRSAVPIIVADTETNGLIRPHLRDGRRAWDYALCRRDPDGSMTWLEGFIDLRDLPWELDDPDLDRVGLDIGRFFERHPQVNPDAKGKVYREADMARMIWEFFQTPSGQEGERPVKPWLIGAVPSFDEAQMADLLWRYDYIESEGPWNYHPVCVEVMASGRLRLPPPWNAKKMSRQLGVDPELYAEHTARGDVEWALALYDACLRNSWWRWLARARLALRGWTS